MLPSLLTREPSNGVSSVDRLKATNDVRAPIVAFLVAAGAAVTVWFTASTYRLGRDAQVTERFTRAVSQLGDQNTEVRVGGIYALERIADDSTRDRVTIIFILGALVRHRSREDHVPNRPHNEDVVAALRVLGRLSDDEPHIRINLRAADLRGADLSNLVARRLILTDVLLDEAQQPSTEGARNASDRHHGDA